ncbi:MULTISPECIES: pirin family protein [Vibrio]|jgi:redox-sensitive bicupin YhaK (pirin superfamily)|uniref:Pirin family protein n=1 Tax=Vibrio mediterranei TaxID=689 RepID=A0A2S9ZR52_9VIBR|nr:MULTISPECIES: pirin family protein [Vibrio]AYV23297.1 pirin family protein [Vibrio mediterranei]EDL51738.1 Pirin-related protein [Vibrio mediterranei AK1]MCG9658758.1 pirin family protein [Vibrio mediterranei]MCG9663054.1 pirin family protein [Vibrio mediterranei]MDA0108379.1 pirin family protein [Vibrio sp. La 4.2.2]
MTLVRTIEQVIPSHATSDGDGVKIRRVHGFDNAAFSPFLMIDELKSDDKKDYVGGFPPHPHRGIETLTYMMKGHFQHKDHMGNVGELRSGGAQWMAAGRGVIHSEMPIMEEGDLHGFQIWINQPAKNKMTPAQYHDFQPETITEYEQQGSGLIRLLSGEIRVNGSLLAGPLTKTGVPATVADWRSNRGDSVRLNVPSEHNMMLYVYKGAVSVADKSLKEGELALVSKGEAMEMTASSESGVLVFVGEPINEPVVHYGPFVMNSMQEIQQAINDYNSGVFDTY